MDREEIAEFIWVNNAERLPSYFRLLALADGIADLLPQLSDAEYEAVKPKLQRLLGRDFT